MNQLLAEKDREFRKLLRVSEQLNMELSELKNQVKVLQSKLNQ